MSDLITDEMVVATAKRLDPDAWEMTAGDYQDAYGRSYGNSESFIRSARRTAMSKARAILRLAAPLIAAKALRDAADAWRAIQRTDDHLLRQWLDARADEIATRDV